MSDFIKLSVWDPHYSVGSQELTVVLNVANISHFTLQEAAMVYLNSGQVYILTQKSVEAIAHRFLDQKLLEPTPNQLAEDSYLTQAAKKVYKSVIG